MEESKEKERNLIHDHFLSWVSLNPQKYKWVEGVKGNQKGRMGWYRDVGPAEAS